VSATPALHRRAGTPTPPAKNTPDKPGTTPATIKHAAVNEVCGDNLKVLCAENLTCYRLTRGTAIEGTCVTSPRKTGEACNFSAPCSKDLYCAGVVASEGRNAGTPGVCQPRAAEGGACGVLDPSGKGWVLCLDGFGCLIEQKGGKGVCMKVQPDVGAKCSPYGSLYCNLSKGTYCHLDEGKESGVCTATIALGAKCGTIGNNDVPCNMDGGCYKEDTPDGVCVKAKDTPVGAKCNYVIGCVDGAYCSKAPTKAYGVCKDKHIVGQPCGDELFNTCKEGLLCDKTKMCVEDIRDKGRTCTDKLKCKPGLTCKPDEKSKNRSTCQ